MNNPGKAWQNVGECNSRIAEKCNDPCLQLFDTPLETQAASAKASVETDATQTSETTIEAALVALLERLAVEGELETLLMIGDEGDLSDPGGRTVENEAQVE